MKNAPSTMMFVLRWHGLQFVLGLALTAKVVWAYAHQPAPLDAPYVSLVSMLFPWICAVGLLGGVWNMVSAWRKGSKLRSGG